MSHELCPQARHARNKFLKLNGLIIGKTSVDCSLDHMTDCIKAVFWLSRVDMIKVRQIRGRVVFLVPTVVIVMWAGALSAFVETNRWNGEATCLSNRESSGLSIVAGSGGFALA